jgi:hypothetical protein
MIAGMAPVLDPESYHFCVVPDAALMDQALALFREEEGLTLILKDAVAQAHGLTTDMPMARITLSVHSALDGVGLTAAVASGLAQAGIPCNMVAAYHHDHAFVPVAQAQEAMTI